MIDNTSVYNIHFCLFSTETNIVCWQREVVSLNREKQVVSLGAGGIHRLDTQTLWVIILILLNWLSNDCLTYVGPFGGYMSAWQSSVYCRGRHKHSVLGRQLQTPRLRQMFCFKLTNVAYRRDKLCWNKREKSSQHEKNTEAHFWGGFGHSAAAVSVFQTECGSCFCLSRDNHFTLAQDGGEPEALKAAQNTFCTIKKSNNFTCVFSKTPFPHLLLYFLTWNLQKRYKLAIEVYQHTPRSSQWSRPHGSEEK